MHGADPTLLPEVTGQSETLMMSFHFTRLYTMPELWARSPPTVCLNLRAKDWHVPVPLLSSDLPGMQGPTHSTAWPYMQPTLGGSSHRQSQLGRDTNILGLQVRGPTCPPETGGRSQLVLWVSQSAPPPPHPGLARRWEGNVAANELFPHAMPVRCPWARFRMQE